METCRDSYNELFALYSKIIYKKIRDTDAEVRFLDWAFHNLTDVEVRRILDVACGTGRHSIPLARLGYKVISMDLSLNMLSTCMRNEDKCYISLSQGDMRCLPFKSYSFDGIFSMFSSFNHMLSDEDIITVLNGFYSCLRPGGILILDLVNPLKFLSSGLQKTEIHKGESNGISVERRLDYRVDEIKALLFQTEHAIIKKGENIWENQEDHHFRFLTYPEIRHFLRDSGFKDIRCFGNFHERREAIEQADRLITIAISDKEEVECGCLSSVPSFQRNTVEASPKNTEG